MRRTPIAAVAAVVFASLTVAGCGVDADHEPRSIPADDLQATGDDATSTTASDVRDTPIGTPERIQVFFAKTQDDEQALAAAYRGVSSPATEGAVLDALLLKPPTSDEREAGLVTAIPTSTRQTRPPVWQDGGVLLVSLNSRLFDVEGETLKVAFGQIVCSVTGLGNVRKVLFDIEGEGEGEGVPVIDGSGEQVNGPVGCDDYENLIPTP